MGSVSINFSLQDVIDDPFPHFEEIRAAGPVVRNEALGVLMVPGHAEVLAVLHDPGRFSSSIYSSPEAPPVMRGVKTMISSDPPEHTRLRRVAQGAFSRRSVARVEGTVSQVVDQILDDPRVAEGLAGADGLDVVGALCRPVPATVIALLLGVPVGDLPRFVGWSEDLVQVASAGRDQLPDWPEVRARAEKAGVELQTYLAEQIEDHRAVVQDDLINDLLVANDDGVLNDAELVASLILLLIAGNETTTNLIGTGLKLLGAHPDQRQLVVDDPKLIEGAVEEILRYEGVVQVVARLASEGSTLAGVDIEAGDVVLLLPGAANRDPGAFPDPGRFDVRRDPNQHLGFGHGVHHCLGASLARLETRLALSAFLRRFPGYEVDRYGYKPVFLARGLDHLRLRG